MKKTLDHLVNIAAGTVLSGAFIYRAFNPLSVLNHPVLGTKEVGKPTYALICVGLAAVSLSYLGYAIYLAIKDSRTNTSPKD